MVGGAAAPLATPLPMPLVYPTNYGYSIDSQADLSITFHVPFLFIAQKHDCSTACTHVVMVEV